MDEGLREQQCCGASVILSSSGANLNIIRACTKRHMNLLPAGHEKERFTKEMQIDYEKYARIFKVMSDPKRLKIIDMLSEGELCACKILEEFHITQPTLSHDMKLMCDLGIVKARKEGKWMQYSLDIDVMNEVYKTVGHLMIPGDYAGLLNCNCNTEKEKMNHE